MKKIFEYIYNYILTFLFIVFAFLSSNNANEDKLFFEITLSIVSLFIIVLVILLNKSKKIENRRIYIISMILSSSYLIVSMIQCIFINSLYAVNIYNYLKYILFGGSIGFLMVLFFMTFKNVFSKQYIITKLDYDSFNMIINATAFILINVFITYNLNIKLDPITFNNIVVFDINKNAILFTLLGYSIAYAIIYLTYYIKFDRNK